MPVKLFEGMAELVDGAAIQLPGRHKVVAGLHEGVENQQLCAMA